MEDKQNRSTSFFKELVRAVFIAVIILLIEYLIFQKPNGDGILRFSHYIVMASAYLFVFIDGIIWLFILIACSQLFFPLFGYLVLAPLIICPLGFGAEVSYALKRNEKLIENETSYKKVYNEILNFKKWDWDNIMQLVLVFIGGIVCLFVYESILSYFSKLGFSPTEEARKILNYFYGLIYDRYKSGPVEVMPAEGIIRIVLSFMYIVFFSMYFLSTPICAWINEHIEKQVTKP